MAKTKRPWWVKLIIALLIVVGVFSVFLGGAVMYFRLSVSDYYANSFGAFVIPDSNKGFIAQGLDYDDKSDCFFVSGYMNDKSASPVYVVSNKTGDTVKKVFLKEPDGETYTGHSGGVAVHGDYVYVASSEVYVYSYTALMNAESGAYMDCLGTVKCIEDEENGLRASYVTTDGNNLVIGEFYR